MEKEKYYIAKLKEEGIKLYNVTLGGELPWNFGKRGYKWSAESIAKRTESRKGYRHSEETKKKIQSNRKYKPSKQNVLNMLKSRKCLPVEVYTKDGVFVGVWQNKSECCRELNLDINKIIQCLKGVTLTHKGYKFKSEGKDFARTVDKRYKNKPEI